MELQFGAAEQQSLGNVQEAPAHVVVVGFVVVVVGVVVGVVVVGVEVVVVGVVVVVVGVVVVVVGVVVVVVGVVIVVVGVVVVVVGVVVVVVGVVVVAGVVVGPGGGLAHLPNHKLSAPGFQVIPKRGNCGMMLLQIPDMQSMPASFGAQGFPPCPFSRQHPTPSPVREVG